MSIQDRLVEIFSSRSGGPFLFLGSGFSRRYLGLEDWKGLLQKFCLTGKPFEYYLASANSDMPTVARLLAHDFNEFWWHSKNYEKSVEKYKSNVNDKTSALRIEICNYLSELNLAKALDSEYREEVELLSGLNLDGIITTNWDTFLEQLFPDYKIYVGQNQLLFSNPQEIGEIYKIHGCSSDPSSLVLTDDDYNKFHEKNAYLAAKLITIFIEHPVVFIGYSISDKNICSLLKAISNCIGKDHIEQLRRNLIFVERLKDNDQQSISDTYFTVDGIQIPLVLIKTDNYSEIYQAIDATKRKIPARVLRYCKEQLYELVQSSEPEKKICVVDIEDIGLKDEVEFLVGVGVVSKDSKLPSKVGYAGLTVEDLIQDLLLENNNYDPEQILSRVIPTLSKYTPYIPTFKYLFSMEIYTPDEYELNEFGLDKITNKDIKNFRLNTFSKSFFKNYRHLSIQEIISSCTPENSANYIPFLAKEKIDLAVLKQFLIDNLDKIDYETSSYASNFRKLAALYDKLKWGW
jgi:hypothetical protein